MHPAVDSTRTPPIRAGRARDQLSVGSARLRDHLDGGKTVGVTPLASRARSLLPPPSSPPPIRVARARRASRHVSLSRAHAQVKDVLALPKELLPPHFGRFKLSHQARFLGFILTVVMVMYWFSFNL